MHTNALMPIIACLAGFLAMALATSGGLVDDLTSSQHIYHPDLHSLDHPHMLTVKHDVQLQERQIQSSRGPAHRCHDPAPEIFGPAPPVEDCNDVIKQFTALTAPITVNLVEGCYQIVSGNCTGLVCPQRPGVSTVSGAQAAQYMASPVRDECIAHGQRGWWIDGLGLGVGVYLT
ncbi:hypothetical protein F5Y09DRAFT_325385 [Xylaria sp. FL1042]|nr:hypothetical protein F5Y09DRAFT_325385 [Xylaria sp. FL1042]